MGATSSRIDFKKQLQHKNSFQPEITRLWQENTFSKLLMEIQ